MPGLLDTLVQRQIQQEQADPGAIQQAMAEFQRRQRMLQLQQQRTPLNAGLNGQQLSTGPVQWDEESLQKAREALPGSQMQGLAPYLIPGGAAAGALGGAVRSRGLLNMLRDPRLEMMFRR